MPDRDPLRPLGEAIQEAYLDALQRWSDEHRKGTDRETFLTSELVSATITANVDRRRGTYVYIQVVARKPWHAGTYGYRLLSRGNGHVAPGMKRVI